MDILKFGLIFGVLGTAPIVTWLALSWLFTDRLVKALIEDRAKVEIEATAVIPE